MSNSQARLIALAVIVLAGAVMVAGRAQDIGVFVVGVAALAFVVQFVCSLHERERVWTQEGEGDFAECDNCGCDLTGIVSGICPECGKPIVEDSSVDEIEDDPVMDDDPPATGGHEWTK
jgi:hypothetical protein